jgi:hypothetical protein
MRADKAMPIAKIVTAIFRQATVEENDGSKCTGLCGDSELSLVEVVPDLDSNETDWQTKDNAQRWQHARRDRLERASTVIHR